MDLIMSYKNEFYISQQEKWLTKCNEWKNKWSYQLKETEINKAYNTIFSIYEIMELVSRSLTEDIIVVTDAGSPSYTCPVNLRNVQNGRFIFSQSQADMGFSIPASVGVALSSNKNVLVIVGDGSFMSNIQELATINYLKLPIKILVLNNDGYMSIKNTQKNFFNNRVYGVDASSGVNIPNICDLSKAFNINYMNLSNKLTSVNDFPYVIRDFNPCIIEAYCHEVEEIIPMQSFKVVEGKTVQAPLDDMYPFLDNSKELY